MKKDDKTQLLTENVSLFEATLNEFANNSYALASTNVIIKNSNINKGSFYYRFSSKEEIFVAMMDYIIVRQIDIFNQRKFNLTNLNTLNIIIFELFYNLVLLNNENPKYYKILSKHLKDEESSAIIEKNCIQHLKVRFYKKFTEFDHIENFEHIFTLIDNLYHDFPKNILESKNVEEDLKLFIDFILSKEAKVRPLKRNKNSNLSDFQFNEPITFLLVENTIVDIPKQYLRFSELYIDFETTKKKIKKLLKFPILSYEKCVLRFIKNSYKDISYLLAFTNEKVLTLCRNNPEFEKIMYASLLVGATEEPYVALDFILDKFSQEEKNLFHLNVLPIISKTSKILVLSDSFDLSSIVTELYLLNPFNQIKKLDPSHLLPFIERTIEIEYIEGNDRKIDYIKIDSLSKTESYSGYNLVSVRLINKIDYKTIMINEEKL